MTKFRIWNTETLQKVVWNASLGVWSLAQAEDQPKIVVSDATMSEKWVVGPEAIHPTSQPPLQVNAVDGVADTVIDPTAQNNSPFIEFDFRIPPWLSDLVGAPTYVSFNMYVSLDSHLVAFDEAKEETWQLELDVGSLLTAAKVVIPIIRHVTDRLVYYRIIAYGILNPIFGRLVETKCYVRTRAVRASWPTYTVGFHAILACGSQTLEPLDPPPPHLDWVLA